MKTEIPEGMRINFITKDMLLLMEEKGVAVREFNPSDSADILAMQQLSEISGNVGYRFEILGEDGPQFILWDGRTGLIQDKLTLGEIIIARGKEIIKNK